MLKPWRIRIGRIGAGSFGVGPSSAVLNKQKAKRAKKGLFTGTALEHLNLGRCP